MAPVARLFVGVQLVRRSPPPAPRRPGSAESRQKQHMVKCGILMASFSRFGELQLCVHFELKKVNNV